MTTRIPHHLLPAAVLCLTLCSVPAQPGPGGAQMNEALTKLFGNNHAFSATMETEARNTAAGGPITMSGKFAFDDGKARLEMDMAQMHGGQIPPNAVAQMKAMGMDRLVSIARPDKKLYYLIYPGLKAYVSTATPDEGTSAAPSDFKIETTKLGKETVDGHACVKNKALVTDSKGEKHPATVWNATDLKNFPVKIVQTSGGVPVTIHFKDVELSAPDAALFEPPSDFKRYDSMQALMQAVMMKRFGGGQKSPPPPGH
jgi:hypothetical protein